MRARFREEIAKAIAAWCEDTPRWGISDCAMALANIDRVVLGRDTARGWRGRYRSEKTAMRLMGKGGIVSMAARIARAARWRRLADVSKAQDGDRGVANTPNGFACVIRYRGFWVGRTHGVGHLLASDREIVRAWSIA